MAFFSAHCLIMLFICTKFRENILRDIRGIEQTRFPIFNFSKGYNSVKYVGGVKILILCTSFDYALCFMLGQSFMRISKRVSELLRD